MNLTQKIKTKALELGFDKIGIANPANQLNHLDYLNEWLANGKNGTMDWLERRANERKDITKYYPQVRSVISVAINYFTGRSSDIVDNKKDEFKFSNYAWGVDYHTIVKEKLKTLLESIKNEMKTNANGVICVDSSPILEKQWAKQSGIGWQGKNTLLINEDLGSWIFLGELLLDVELEYDKPFLRDLCGNCTACINACSVNALSEYKLDASKCISYLTVEHKESFNDNVRLNGWIYGCDTCQQVCPWNNRNETMSIEESFQPIIEIRNYLMEDWVAVDESRFNAIFKNSPIKRIKHHRFLRNINSFRESSNNID